MLTLDIKKREGGSPKAARTAGKLPAVMYGRKEESTPIELDAKAFEKVFRAAGESTVISLSGVGEVKQALIHDVAMNPVTGHPVHADFYIIEKGQKVTVAVPLSFVGVSAAVKDMSGILVKVMHEIELTMDPTLLPHEIEVDISLLSALDSQITISQLKIPAAAELSVDADELVAMISVAQDEPEEPAQPIDLSAIEVEKRGKEETAEGEEGAAA